MAKKKSLYGVSVYVRNKPKKRPGRHTKSLNKHKKRQKKHNGRPWQYSLDILHCGYERKKNNNNK